MSQASEELASLERIAAMTEVEWRQYLYLKHEEQSKAIARVERQALLTNGRVTRLEQFRWAFAGAAGVLSALAVALLPKIAERVLA